MVEETSFLNGRTDEQWLLGFLRGNKFSLERTKEKIDNFYSYRTILPEFFANRDPLLPELEKIIKAGIVLPLPRTENGTGPKLIMLIWRRCDENTTLVVNILKVIFMILDVLQNEDDNFMVSGIKVILDFKEVSLNYCTQFTPSLMKKYMMCLTKGYPMRLKSITCLNALNVIEVVYNFLKPFLTEKLKGRIKIYNENSVNKLYDDIPVELLPFEYEGKNGNIDDIAETWHKKLVSYRDWFSTDSQYCSNECRRPGTPKTSADEFGVEGSFRKINID